METDHKPVKTRENSVSELAKKIQTRHAHWICIYCEASNYSNQHTCDVCGNERRYAHSELEAVIDYHINRKTFNFNPVAIVIIVVLSLLLIL